MNSIIPTNAPAATTAASESMSSSASRTQSIISAALLAQSFDDRPAAVPDEAISRDIPAAVAEIDEPSKDGELLVHKTNDADNDSIHISEVRSYDVLLRRTATATTRTDSSSYEIDQSSSHVGNARFAIMLSMRRNEQRADKENSVSTNDIDDSNNVAAGIIRTLYDECNGRLLVPSENGNITADAYYRDIGNNTPEAFELIKTVLAALPSPSASARTSPIPSTPAGEPSSPAICTKRRKRSSSVHFVVGDLSPGHKIDNSTNSNKRRRRSSLKPSSYGAGTSAAVAAPDTTTSSSAEHVHFAVPITPSDVTSADVVLPTMHDATYLRPDSGIGNNRLRVMVRMVSSRYFEAASSGDDKEAHSIAEEIVRRVNGYRGREGIRGRFLDTTYDEDDNEDSTAMYVEVPHEVAISAVHSFLDEAAGIRTSAVLPTTRVGKTSGRKRNDSNGQNKRRRTSKKKAPSAKLLHGVPIPTHLMPSNIASLRRDAAEDMRKKKAKKVISTSGRTAHGGAKGFSSTLCDSQITKMQDMFRSMAESNANGAVPELPSPKIPSSLLNMTSAAKRGPDSGEMPAADASFRGIPGLSHNHLKQPQARAA